jgi:hypothetical protein
MNYAPDGPPPSSPHAELIGTVEGVRVWVDSRTKLGIFEYWLHLPGVANVWRSRDELDTPLSAYKELTPGLLLAKAHALLIP